MLSVSLYSSLFLWGVGEGHSPPTHQLGDALLKKKSSGIVEQGKVERPTRAQGRAGGVNDEELNPRLEAWHPILH